MATDTLYTMIVAILVAIGMQVYSITKIQSLIRNTKGTIRSRHDLIAVKEVINLNMQMAVIYIILYVIFFIFAAKLFIGGRIFEAIAMLFVFGIITLPVGLVGKSYENKVKSMRVESDDKEIAQIFERYLIQWKQARWKLPD